MKSQSFEKHKRCAFDAFCKKVLKNEARDYCKGTARRRKHELSLDSLSYKDQRQLYVIDDYFAVDAIFTVLDYDIVVADELLASALNHLTYKQQAIILLSYFLGMPDRKIGEELNMIRATVQYHRKRSLDEMKKIIEEEMDETNEQITTL